MSIISKNSHYGPRTITNGLVLCLDAGNRKSYPGSGTTWTDLSGRGNNGTLFGSVGYSGNGGNLTFDGTDDYISFPSNPVLTNQITVDFWVYLIDLTPDPVIPPNNNGMIMGRENSYRLTYDDGTIQWVCATVNNPWFSTGTFINAGFSTPAATGRIINVVATYDGSNNRIYVNGSLSVTSSTISGNILNGGTYYLARSTSAISWGKLNMYSHKLYNRALTAGEIAQNFNATRSRYSV